MNEYDHAFTGMLCLLSCSLLVHRNTGRGGLLCCCCRLEALVALSIDTRCGVLRSLKPLLLAIWLLVTTAVSFEVQHVSLYYCCRDAGQHILTAAVRQRYEYGCTHESVRVSQAAHNVAY